MPAPAVIPVVLDCAAKGVKGLVVVSAGVAEPGEDEGPARQAELVRRLDGVLADGVVAFIV